MMQKYAFPSKRPSSPSPSLPQSIVPTGHTYLPAAIAENRPFQTLQMQMRQQKGPIPQKKRPQRCPKNPARPFFRNCGQRPCSNGTHETVTPRKSPLRGVSTLTFGTSTLSIAYIFSCTNPLFLLKGSERSCSNPLRFWDESARAFL